MSKNKNLVQFVTILSLLVMLPSVANAAWWNPFSWFEKKPSTIQRNVILEKKLPDNPKNNNSIGAKIQKNTTNKKQINDNKIHLLEASKTLSNKKIIAKVKPSVTYIETESGSGSGMIISNDGFILTNAHVVADTVNATVKISDGREFSGIVIGRDENVDVALVKIDANGLPSVELGDSNSIEQGDSIFTFGYPFGIEGDVAFKDGTLSRRRKVDNIMYLEISAQILPGNSGGPLVNQLGEVIGINTWAQADAKIGKVLVGETLKYALPINAAKELISYLKNGRNIIKPKSAIPSAVPPSPAPSQNYPIQPYPVLPWQIPTYQPTPQPVSLMISDIKVDLDTDIKNSVEIYWKANKSLMVENVKVLYGTNSNLSNAQVVKPGNYGNTYARLHDLEPEIKYYIQIVVNIDEAKSDIINFTTKPDPTAQKPPKISNIIVSNISTDGVGISWNTDEKTFAKLEYRKSSDSTYKLLCIGYSSSCSNTSDYFGVQTMHKYRINGLEAGTTYNYRITAANPSPYSQYLEGATTISDVLNFETVTPPPPTITTKLILKPTPTFPEFIGEFMFYHTNSQIEGTFLDFKIQVTLSNATSTNTLSFYTGKCCVWSIFSNVKSGDVLEINSFLSNQQLLWSYSGNPDDLSLKIIDGKATKDGKNIKFEF